MKSLEAYLNHLLARGRYFFSKQEALHDLGIKDSQLRFQAYRLSKKGSLKRLSRDFFMIISPEYAQIGSLPPQWIVDALMRHLDQEYYIGLLSAAAFYGTTEQQPMTFQVLTTQTTKKIHLGRSLIEFHAFKGCVSASKSTIKMPTGYAKISTREQTIVDLIRFYETAGYLSNVTAVIKDLAEEVRPELFEQIIKRAQTKSVLQRLGYILDLLKLSQLAEVVAQELAHKKIEYISLRPDMPYKNASKNNRWKLIINDTIEIP